MDTDKGQVKITITIYQRPKIRKLFEDFPFFKNNNY